MNEPHAVQPKKPTEPIYGKSVGCIETPRAPCDRDAARRFLNRLDPDSERFTYQTYTDGEKPKPDPLRRIWHGSIDQQFQELANLNKRGASVCVTINETDFKGRTAENIVRVRSVFAEMDEGPIDPCMQCALEPSMVVESSPGKYHVYWLVDGLPIEQFHGVQNVIIRRFGADPSCKDVARVLRVPGFHHQKHAPHMVRMIHDSGAQPFSAERVLREFHPVEGANNGRISRRLKLQQRDDPILSALNDRGMILGERPDGAYNIRCPFEADHTSPSAESGTTYFLPHTGGYKTAKIHCFHAHCVDRPMDAYRDALGIAYKKNRTVRIILFFSMMPRMDHGMTDRRRG